MYKFKPAKLFMDCDYYGAYATEKTKRVFGVVAAYSGEQCESRRDQIRRVIEIVTGLKMSNLDKKDASSLEVLYNDFFIRLIMRDVGGSQLDQQKAVYFYVYRMSEFRKQRTEHEAVKDGANMDAL